MDQDQLDEAVARLRRQGTDDATAEAKTCAKDLSKDVWDSVSAFANTAGGLLVLGLDERAGFTAVPSFALDRVLDQFVDGIGDGNPAGARLTNPPTYRVSRLAVDGDPVLAIEVAENGPGNKPCHVTAKGLVNGSFRRVDDKDLPLSATEIFEFQHVLVDHAADRRTVAETTIEDLDPAATDRLLTLKADSKALRGVDDRDARLRRLNVVDAEGRLRLAALITLSPYPQQFLPRLLVDVMVHPTNEKSSPTERFRYLDRQECEGPLAEVVNDAVNAVARNLRTHSTVTGSGRVDELEIPRDVLREAVANAVLHREYHPLFQGQPVTVDVFPERVVVTSPGGLWGGKTVDNLADGRSRCRNQTLLQLLQDVPLATGETAAEGGGGGILLMIHQMEAHALERPRFRVTPDSVTVELRRHGVEIAANQEWLRGRTTDDLPRQEAAILLMARREGSVDVQSVREALHIDSDDARGALAHLVGADLLSRRGPENYTLTPDSTPPGTDVLSVLSTTDPMDVHAVATATGWTVATVRRALRRLIQDGLVTATAAPTSRNRRYLRRP
ncbi:ATP-binding protein [Kineococcus sp. NPDC059986]|uniref:ATP-binding protein n=1 Tax=Kineococcus sp. NPDC059986 TaxID=3155538 RepID=UPI003450622B